AGGASGKVDATHRNRNRHIASTRIRRINGHKTSIRVLQIQVLHAGHEDVWGHGADIETAQIIFAAHAKTLVRRRHVGTPATDEAALQVNAQRVLVIQRLPLREAHHRTIEGYVSSDTGDIARHKKASASIRTNRTVNRAEAEDGDYLACNNPRKRVGTGDVAEVDAFEIEPGSIAESLDAGVVPRICNTDAL